MILSLVKNTSAMPNTASLLLTFVHVMLMIFKFNLQDYEKQEEERQKFCTFKPAIHVGTNKIWEAHMHEIKARNGGQWKETVQDRLLRHAAEGKIRANSEIDNTKK